MEERGREPRTLESRGLFGFVWMVAREAIVIVWFDCWDTIYVGFNSDRLYGKVGIRVQEDKMSDFGRQKIVISIFVLRCGKRAGI